MSPQRPRRDGSERATLPALWRGWRAPAVLVAVAALGVWLQLASGPRQSSKAPLRPDVVSFGATAQPSRSVTSRTAEQAPPVLATLSPELEARAAEWVEPEAEPSSAEAEHPHPITPEHRRIFEENNRVGALNGAMDRGDFMALRRLNAAYGRDYPEDAHALSRAYDLIADCLEQRTPRAVDAARRFWLKNRASTLRRHVRRHCLDEPMTP